MRLIRENDALFLTADKYQLIFAADRPYVYLNDSAGNQLADLFVLSSIHTLIGRDDTTQLGKWTVNESADEILFTLEASSSLWNEKKYYLRCFPHRFEYGMDVAGEGALAEVNYFGGYFSGERHWGTGFFWSGQYFTRLFNPEPNREEVNYLAASGGAVIDLTGVPLPIRGGWFFTPPPFCFCCQSEAGWLCLGVQPEAGANRFTEYQYHGQIDGFHLTLSYEGHTQVQGQYRLPSIGFDFADNEFSAMQAHVKNLSDNGWVNLGNSNAKPTWWYEPIFCGWGAQCALWAAENQPPEVSDPNRASITFSGTLSPMDYCRQELYEEFLDTLEQHNLNPGTLTIDDKWQRTYGENCVDETRWHDLRGFIQQQHSKNRHVLLWLRAWGAEGLPEDECILNPRGIVVTCDPTNPKFETRLRESVHCMLSPDGYDADGFKIDFTGRSPSGPSLQSHGAIWGLELMKLYLKIIYEQAKQTKPDALLITHTPHPYLADVVDMIRLNDLNPRKDVVKAMYLRARIASIGCPNALIDTDNWQTRDKMQWREYTRHAAELGVPSLYYVDRIDATQEPFDEEDYELIRETWEQYRQKINHNGL